MNSKRPCCPSQSRFWRLLTVQFFCFFGTTTSFSHSSESSPHSGPSPTLLRISLPRYLRYIASPSYLNNHNKWERANHACLYATTQNQNSENTNKEEATLFGFPRETVATPLGILLISQFLLFIGVGAVIPSIPLYGKEIGLSSAANGLVISAPAVALLVGAKVGGNFADKARKPAMLIGMGFIAASDIGTALSTGIFTLVLARLGLGAGRCVSEAGERGMLADLAGQAPELRGRALAAQQAVVALGIAIGAPLGGMVVEAYGPRASFLCVSAAAMVTLVLYLFLPETVTFENRNDAELDGTTCKEAVLLVPAEAVGDIARESSSSSGDWRELLSKQEWRGLALCQCGTSFGFAAKIASIPILATSTLPGGAAGAGALLSAAGLSGLVGAPIGGWLTDQTSARSTAAVSGTVSAIGLLLIPLALGFSADQTNGGGLALDHVLGGRTMGVQALAFSAVVLLWSLGASAQGPALTALAQELAPTGAEATAMALPRAAGDGTYIVAPFLLGLAADSFEGTPGIECAVAGFMMILGVLGLMLLKDNSTLEDSSTR